MSKQGRTVPTQRKQALERIQLQKCANKLESYEMLQEHISLHDETEGRTSHECDICGIKGSSEQYMDKHIESMHTCVECKTLFDDVYELNRHKENVLTEEFNSNTFNFSTKLLKI